MEKASEFQTSGPILASDKRRFYVERSADRELSDFIEEGLFAHILTSRQMGKTSLINRHREKLEVAGISTAYIDVVALGQQQENTWYRLFIERLAEQLDISSVALNWLAENEGKRALPADMLVEFIETVVLKPDNGKLVIYVDEIDSTLGLRYRDTFFNRLREMDAMSRNQVARLRDRRLLFVLAGVATPDDLRSINSNTSYNYSRPVVIQDFSRKQMDVFLPGLQSLSNPEEILDWVWETTSGHPCLSQILCDQIASEGGAYKHKSDVERVVTDLIINGQGNITRSLKEVGKLLSEHTAHAIRGVETPEVLGLYRRVRRASPDKLDARGGPPGFDGSTPLSQIQFSRANIKGVPDLDGSKTHTYLKLIGAVRSEYGKLIIRNPVYREYFNEEWIEDSLKLYRRRKGSGQGAQVSDARVVVALRLIGKDATALRERVESICEEEGFSPKLLNLDPNHGDDFYQESNQIIEQADLYLAIVNSHPRAIDFSNLEAEWGMADKIAQSLIVGKSAIDFLPTALRKISQEINSVEELVPSVRRTLRTFLEKNPEVPDRRLLRSYCLNVLKDYAPADPYSEQRLAQQPDLSSIYVGLKATPEAPDVDQRFMYEEIHLARGRELSPNEKLEQLQKIWQVQDRSRLRRKSEATDGAELSDLVANHKRLVILGDPGSGKTTFLRFLAYLFSREALQNTGDMLRSEAELPSIWWESVDLGAVQIPLFIRIPSYAEALEAQKNKALSFGDFLRLHYSKPFPHQLGERLAGIIERMLSQGRCLILLDGLDEVGDQQDRAHIVAVIEGILAREGYDANRVIVTSRIVGYQFASLSPAFALHTIAPMDDEQIKRFIDLRCDWAEKTASPSWPMSQEDMAAGILAAISASDSIRVLARNPLLLSILIRIYQTDSVIPQRRVQLYSAATRQMLHDWKELQRPGIDLERYAIELLGPLAVYLHENVPSGLVRRRDALRLLKENIQQSAFAERVGDPEKEAERFLKFLENRPGAGIFIERGQGMYGFRHLTFEEYLVARNALGGEIDPNRFIRKYLHQPRWREPLLLTIAYQSDSSKFAAVAMIRNILNSPGPYEDVLHRDKLFAADALMECVSTDPDLVADLCGSLAQLYCDQHGKGRFNRLRLYLRQAISSLHQRFYKEVENSVATLFESVETLEKFESLIELITEIDLRDQRFVGLISRSQFYRSSPEARDAVSRLKKREAGEEASEKQPLTSWAENEAVASSLGALWAMGGLQNVITAALALPESALKEMHQSAAQMYSRHYLSLIERIVRRTAAQGGDRDDFVSLLIAMSRSLKSYAHSSGDPRLEALGRAIGPMVYFLWGNDLQSWEIAETLLSFFQEFNLPGQEMFQRGSRLTDWGRQLLNAAQGGARLERFFHEITSLNWTLQLAESDQEDFENKIDDLRQRLFRFSLESIKTAEDIDAYYEHGVFLGSGEGLGLLLHHATQDNGRQQQWARQILSDPAFVASVRYDSKQRDSLFAWLDRKDELRSTALALLLVSERITPALLDASMALLRQNKQLFRSRIAHNLSAAEIVWTPELLAQVKKYLADKGEGEVLASRLIARVLVDPLQSNINSLLDWLSDESEIVSQTAAIRLAGHPRARANLQAIDDAAKARINEYVKELFAKAPGAPQQGEWNIEPFANRLSPGNSQQEIWPALRELSERPALIPQALDSLARLVMGSPDWRTSLTALSLLLDANQMTPPVWTYLHSFTSAMDTVAPLNISMKGKRLGALGKWMSEVLERHGVRQRFPVGALFKIVNDPAAAATRAAAGLALLCADVRNQMMKGLVSAMDADNDIFRGRCDASLDALCEALPSDGSTGAIATLTSWYKTAIVDSVGARGTWGVTALSRIAHESSYWVDHWLESVKSQDPEECELSRNFLHAWLTLRGAALQSVCDAARQGQHQMLRTVAVECLDNAMFNHDDLKRRSGVIDALLFVLSNGDGRARRAAAMALQWSFIRDEEIALALLDRVANDPDEPTRIICLLSLGRLLSENLGANAPESILQKYEFERMLAGERSDAMRRAALCAIACVLLNKPDSPETLSRLLPENVLILQALLDARSIPGTVLEEKLKIDAIVNWILKLSRDRQQELIKWLISAYEDRVSYKAPPLSERFAYDETESPFQGTPNLRSIAATLSLLSEKFPPQFFGNENERRRFAKVLAGGAQNPNSWQVRQFSIQILGNLQRLDMAGMEALSKSCYDVSQCVVATSDAIGKFKDIEPDIVYNLSSKSAAGNGTKIGNAVKLIGRLGLYRSDALSERHQERDVSWRKVIGEQLKGLLDICEDTEITDEWGRPLGTVGDAIFEALEQVESGPDARIAMNDDKPVKKLAAQSPTDQDVAFFQSQPATGLPPGITNTAGWNDERIREKIQFVRKKLEWENTTGSARKWWEAFEIENQSRLALILRLAEELFNRKATITEFFLAYVYSNTENIQANLHYLDYTRLKKEEERRKRAAATPTSPVAVFGNPQGSDHSPTAEEADGNFPFSEFEDFDPAYDEHDRETRNKKSSAPSRSFSAKNLLDRFSKIVGRLYPRTKNSGHSQRGQELHIGGQQPPQSRGKDYLPLAMTMNRPKAYLPLVMDAPANETVLPPGITNTAGWNNERIRERIEHVRKELDWENTTGSARKWWEAFEIENQSRLALILRLAEELLNRKATITEFFLAYVYSNTENIQANLHYLDFTRLKKEWEQRDKERASDPPEAVEEDPRTDEFSQESEEEDGAPLAHNDVEDRLRQIVVEQLGVFSDQVTLESSFIESLGADSLDLVELVMAVEEEYDIEIPDADAEKILTFGDAVNYVRKSLA
jgi:acyl carrier protein